jgi:GMP synthase-like glutamine amidotransferase
MCFSHQLMAEAFGGRADKSLKGWGPGVHRYVLHHDVQGLAGTRERAAISSIASHQDQVTVPPSTARVLGGSDFTLFCMLDYGADRVSLQLHPEFSTKFTEALLRLRLARLSNTSEAENALGSLTTPIDSAAIGRWLGRVLRTEDANKA